MLKTEGKARGFQHFPADIKSVTSLLVPFLKQYQFSNKNQFELDYERGVFRDIAVRRFKEVLKTEGEARGFQHFPADIKSVTSLITKHLRTKVTPDFHLTYSKNRGNLGSESK